MEEWVENIVDAVDQQPISNYREVMTGPRFEVLGPLAATDADGAHLPLRGPRHREVLALLLIARGRVVPLTTIVDEIWADAPPARAAGSVRTFISDLRRVLEPDRARPSVLVTESVGYALRTSPDAVDAGRFEAAVHSAERAGSEASVRLLTEALAEWRGEPYTDFADAPWAADERARLDELRDRAVERLAALHLEAGRNDEALMLVQPRVASHPWREEGWRILALALYRSGRQAEALAALAEVRSRFADRLGLDPGRALGELERDILRGSDSIAAPSPAAAVWQRAAAGYEQAGARMQLPSAVALSTGLAVSGRLESAGEQRLAAIRAAEELDDPELTARVIGAYDVPGVWTRSDDAASAAHIVAAAEQALAALPPHGHRRARAHLLSTIAMESRGEALRAAEAREGERLARELGDPALLCFALGGCFMQAFERTGLAAQRDAIGAEIVSLAQGHELPTFEIQGRLIRMQALAALGDEAAAATHADLADELGERHDRPLVGVFTGMFRAMLASDESAYRRSFAMLHGAGMPGVERGLLPLALVCLRLRAGDPIADGDFGPYEPWVRPLLLARRGARDAGSALRNAADPPRDLLQEALWVMLGHAARELDDEVAAARVREALEPAKAEIAAGSGVVSAGPVSEILSSLP